MNILVSGGTGFIGRSLLKRFNEMGYKLWACVRNYDSTLPVSVKQTIVNDSFDFVEATVLKDIDIIIHLAGRAHIFDSDPCEAVLKHRRVNAEGTKKLGLLAVKYGVKRFVFISTIGVNGVKNSKPFSEKDIIAPSGPYAVSKYEAEMSLKELSDSSDLEVVIIRPPLVYGHSAPGNFGAILKWVESGWPLPFGLVENKKAFVGLDNLVGFVATCMVHPNAKNEVFLVSDGVDISLPEMLRVLAKVKGYKLFLVPVPARILKFFIVTLMRKNEEYQKLTSSLEVDISKAEAVLGWKPLLSMEKQLES
jgi:nucleoside-diphosphate-sugar epimerase